MVYRILCAIDGSEHAKHAVSYASDLAKRMDADLAIAIVNVAMGAMRGSVHYAWEETEAKQLLDEAAAEARKAGVSTVREAMLVSREASSGIVQYAEEGKFDHIVTGTGDKKGVSRLVLGSVAADVARRAHCSVTVAR
jgi:nucleotide-binding universal stress UspA family protein